MDSLAAWLDGKRRANTRGPLWQPEYWDRLIRSENHYYKCAEYIRQNPEKAGLKVGFVIWEAPEQNNGAQITEHGLSSP